MRCCWLLITNVQWIVAAGKCCFFCCCQERQEQLSLSRLWWPGPSQGGINSNIFFLTASQTLFRPQLIQNSICLFQHKALDFCQERFYVRVKGSSVPHSIMQVYKYQHSWTNLKTLLENNPLSFTTHGSWEFITRKQLKRKQQKITPPVYVSGQR